MQKVFLLLILGMFAFGIFTGCDQYAEIPPGGVGAVRKGAGWRQEGGGIQAQELWAGTRKVGGPTTDVDVNTIGYAPQLVSVTDLPVTMVKMKNQRMVFDLNLLVMQRPDSISFIFGNFPNWKSEVERTLKEAGIKILSRIDMGIDVENISVGTAARVKSEFDDQLLVADKILEQVKTDFRQSYPAFYPCFHFGAVSINDLDFPPEVIKALENAAADLYKTEVLKVESQRRGLESQLLVKQSNIDFEAMKIEAKALNDDVMSYLSYDMVSRYMQDGTTTTYVFMVVDKRGNPIWFQIDDGKLAEKIKSAANN